MLILLSMRKVQTLMSRAPFSWVRQSKLVDVLRFVREMAGTRYEIIICSLVSISLQNNRPDLVTFTMSIAAVRTYVNSEGRVRQFPHFFAIKKLLPVMESAKAAKFVKARKF